MQTTNGKKKKNPSSLHAFKFSLPSFFRLYVKALATRSLFFSYRVSPEKDSLALQTFLRYLEEDTRIAGYHFEKEKQMVHIFLNYDL